MSLQIDSLATVAVGIAIGLIFGFVFTMRMYKSSMMDMLTRILDEFDNSMDDSQSVCPLEEDELEEDAPIAPYLGRSKENDHERNRDYTINQAVQEYIKSMGYTSDDLEDEK